MKLLNNKYRMKPIQLENNRERLLSSMDENIKKVYPGMIKDLEPSLFGRRNKLRREIVNVMEEKHLMYANEVIMNYEKELVIIWFKHFGTSNISLVVSKGVYKVFYKSNNTKTVKEKWVKKGVDAIKLVTDILDEIPEIEELIKI